MARLNLTLDQATYDWLGKQARKTRSKRAALARKLLQESLQRAEAQERARSLARAYASLNDPQVRELQRDLELGTLDLLGSEDD